MRWPMSLSCFETQHPFLFLWKARWMKKRCISVVVVEVRRHRPSSVLRSCINCVYCRTSSVGSPTFFLMAVKWRESSARMTVKMKCQRLFNVHEREVQPKTEVLLCLICQIKKCCEKFCPFLTLQLCRLSKQERTVIGWWPIPSPSRETDGLTLEAKFS